MRMLIYVRNVIMSENMARPNYGRPRNEFHYYLTKNKVDQDDGVNFLLLKLYNKKMEVLLNQLIGFN